jgi:hypothetical protein
VSLEVQKLVAGYEPAGQPSAPLVAIARAPELRALEPFEPARGRVISSSEGRILPKFGETGPAVVMPVGEVWMGPDRHARLVARSEWVARDAAMLRPVVWADESKTSADLEPQEVILGPKARQRLLAAKPGPDAPFLAWLREANGRAPLADQLAGDAKDRERAVNRLVDALSRSKGATGFAVLDTKGNLLGTELFLDREVMLAFAPRLLRGYLLEAGDDGIRVGAPGVGGAEERVARLLEGVPGRGLRVEREALDTFADAVAKERGTRGAPDGVARVTLFAASGQAVGHGLVHGDTPIHLTLFGE